jgi:hypothetical protein
MGKTTIHKHNHVLADMESELTALPSIEKNYAAMPGAYACVETPEKRRTARTSAGKPGRIVSDEPSVKRQ